VKIKKSGKLLCGCISLTIYSITHNYRQRRLRQVTGFTSLPTASRAGASLPGKPGRWEAGRCGMKIRPAW